MLIDVVLPLSLAIVMFSLGYGLSFNDFRRVFAMPKAILVGLVLQVVVLPIVAYLLLLIFHLPPALAFGFMILSFCPGGVTSNMLTKLAGGAVALSITLTALVSLLSGITTPLLVSWAAGQFLDQLGISVDVSSLTLKMFALTVFPVLTGLLVRSQAKQFAEKTEKIVSNTAFLLLVVIILATLAVNWRLLAQNLEQLGPVVITLNLIVLLLGALVAKLTKLPKKVQLCIAIETAVQNAAVGITIAGLVAQVGGIPEYALPSAVYGALMYVVSLPGFYFLKKVLK